MLAKPLGKDLGAGFLDSDIEMVGPWYTGELQPGTKTIFSEGIQNSKIAIGPAKHWFTSTHPGTRKWRRYTYDAYAHTNPPILGHVIPDNQAI